jgi:hypothetical protein
LKLSGAKDAIVCANIKPGIDHLLATEELLLSPEDEIRNWNFS